jgi:hypothetical protein
MERSGVKCFHCTHVFDLTNLKGEKRRNVGKLNNELNIVNQFVDLHFLLFVNITGNWKNWLALSFREQLTRFYHKESSSPHPAIVPIEGAVLFELGQYRNVPVPVAAYNLKSNVFCRKAFTEMNRLYVNRLFSLSAQLDKKVRPKFKKCLFAILRLRFFLCG